MDCGEIRDILEAYALGASDEGEAAAIEEHVGDCIRCWEELTKSQQTAALLALSLPIERAPGHLEARIMASAEREREPETETQAGAGLSRWLRLGWQPAAGALGVAGVAALVFAGLLQMQLNDLRNENGALGDEISRQEERFGVLSSEDNQRINLRPVASSDMLPEPSVAYNWSAEKGKGFIHCENLPPIDESQEYTVWFTTDAGRKAMESFVSHDGTCRMEVMDLRRLDGKPDGIGITVGESGTPGRWSDDWVVFSALAKD